MMEYGNEILISVMSAIFVTMLSYSIIYRKKPKLVYDYFSIDDKIIKVKIIRKGRFIAVNIRIGIYTLHPYKSIYISQ